MSKKEKWIFAIMIVILIIIILYLFIPDELMYQYRLYRFRTKFGLDFGPRIRFGTFETVMEKVK